MPQSPQSVDALIKRFGGVVAPPPDTSAPVDPAKFGGSVVPPPEPQGSAIRRAAGGFITGGGFNPIDMIEGLYNTFAHPIDTVTNLVSPLQRLGNVPDIYRRQGLYAAANEAMASVPVIGPASEQASLRMKSGDTAGGLGEVAGLMTSLVMGGKKPTQTAGSAAHAVLPTAVSERLATTADRGSQRRMVTAIAPQKGANATRFGGMAEDVAPRLAREEGMGAVSRADLGAKVESRLAQATTQLDEATDARLSGRAYLTKGIIQGLKDERAKLTAHPIEGSRIVPELQGPGGRPLPSGNTRNVETGRVQKALQKIDRPIGQEQVPAHVAARVAVIDRAIAELEGLGPMASYDAIRAIRQAYDGPAKAVYSPSMTADYIARMGDKLGSADVTRVLRDRLATYDKGTAAANKEFAYWSRVDDVIRAAEETERTRPTRGRAMLSRGIGVGTGAAAGGWLGALTGVIVAEGAERLAQAGGTSKIAVSRTLANLADDLRRGNQRGAVSNLRQVAHYAGLTARLNALMAQQQEEPSR